MLDKYIVGVGASAGGLEALSDLFANLPETLEATTSFIVAQHLSPTHRSMLVQILSKEAVFPVIEAEDNQEIKPGCIYITPPDSDIRVQNGIILLTKPVNNLGPKPSVDMFFTSLAEDCTKNCAGIILSGTGSDGAEGMKIIKRNGGHTFIQNPDTAKYDGMPLASLHTGIVDYSLPPDRIGAKLEEILLNKTTEAIEKGENQYLEAIFQMIQQRYGTNFANYKPTTILRRIDKSLKNLKIKSLKDYVRFLEKNSQEVDSLHQSFLIGVTSFFRDTEAFKVLETEIRKKIVSQEIKGIYRVWIPGCSTGEEAFSMAFMIQYLLESNNLYNVTFQIFATDIDEDSLAFARKGLYSFDQAESIPDDYKEKYLIRSDNGYEVEKKIRSKVLFSRHDLTNNPPFLKLDLISCRNLLIYINPDIQRQIFPVFHYALKEDAVLFLGKSESITQVEDLFETIDSKYKLFRKRKFSGSSGVKYNAFKPMSLVSNPSRRTETQITETYKTRLLRTLADLSQHAYIVVNTALDIVETRGDLTNFIQIPEGLLNLNIAKLVKKDFQVEVKNLMTQVIRDKQTIKSSLKKYVTEGEKFFFRISASQVIRESNSESDDLFLIVFERYDLQDELDKFSPNISDETHHPRILELEQELALTKEHLQNYIEEIETSNEELQSLNEEMQSSNEELQSTNEELETSNEELQSSNEELQTAYAEIKHINHELEIKEQALRQTNGLFNALFESTQQGHILVDADLVIRLFNKQISILFSQVGIDEIKSGRNILEILPDFLLEKLIPQLRKAQQQEGNFKLTLELNVRSKIYNYEFCFTPVAINNKLAYISIGVLDYTDLRLRETELFERDEMLTSLLESNTTYLIRTDMQGNYTYVNDAFCQKFGFTQEQVLGKFYGPTVHPDDLTECDKAVYQLMTGTDKVVTFEIRKPNPAGGYFNTEWEFVMIKNKAGEIVEIQGVGRDITAYKNALEDLKQETNRLELTIWGGRLGTWDWNYVTGGIVFNERWADMLGYDISEIEQNLTSWEKLIHPEDITSVREILDKHIKGETAWYETEYRMLAKNGEWQWILDTGKVIERDTKGKPLRIIGVNQDITEKKHIEAELKINADILTEVETIAKVGGWAFDLVNQKVFWTNETYHIHGIEVGTPMTIDAAIDHYHPDYQDKIRNAAQTLMTTGESFDEEFKIIKTNKEEIWIRAIGKAEYQDGRIVKIVGSCQDINELKESEKAIKISEHRMKSMLATMKEGVVIQDMNGAIISCNQSAQDILGLTMEQMAGVTSLDSRWRAVRENGNPFPGEEHPAMVTLRTGLPQDDVIMGVHKPDDSLTWISINTELLYLEDKREPYAVYCIFHDITERKEVEAIVKQSEEYLSQVLEGLPVATYITDRDGYITFYNRAAEELWGWKPELHKQRWSGAWQLFDKNEQPIRHDESLITGAIRYNKEVRREEAMFARPDGERRHFLANATPFRNDQGELLGAMKVMIDITDRKKMEEELLMLSYVGQRTSNIVIISDADGDIVWVNEAFTRITEYTLEDVIGKKPGKFLQYEQTNVKTIEQISRALVQRIGVKCEIQNRSKSGREYWLELEIQPIYDKANVFRGFMAIESEITDRKNNEASIQAMLLELSAKNKSLEEFSYIISHNLRSPVASILGLADIIRIAKDEATKKQAFDYLIMSSEKLDEILKDTNKILESKGNVRLMKERFNLTALYREVIDLFQNELKLIPHTIDEQLEENIEFVSVKPYIHNVIFNLISNAIKYRKPKITLELKVFLLIESTGEILIKVQDNGLGLDMNRFSGDLFKLYKRFHLEHSGKGLGLFMIRNQVEQLGGKIDFISEEGKGACVEVRLPFFANAAVVSE